MSVPLRLASPATPADRALRGGGQSAGEGESATETFSAGPDRSGTSPFPLFGEALIGPELAAPVGADARLLHPQASPQPYVPPCSVVLRGLGIAGPDLSAPKAEVSTAFLRFLIRELVRPGSFDAEWYASCNPDIRAAYDAGLIASLHEHYVQQGYFEARLPHSLTIDPDWYWSHYRDLAGNHNRREVGALSEHLYAQGWWEGRVGIPEWAKDSSRWLEAARRSAAASASARPAQPRIASPEQALLRNFESLGWNCEFGLVQKHYHVEPLSLLAFGNLPPDNLVKALRSRLEGLGNPETTSIQVNEREFLILDRKYGYGSHTWTYEGQADPERLLQKGCIRIKLLKAKLLRDLSAAKKVFVYTKHPSWSDDTIIHLFSAIRQYGRSTLLWVDLAEGARRSGDVERLCDGLYKGYVDRFSPPDNAASNISYDAWRRVCAALDRMLQNSRP